MRSPLAILVLAAGRGSRMKSNLAKPLHRLAGRPMIQHLLATVAGLAPSRTVVVVGRDMEEVAALAVPADIVVQDPPEGTADAVRCAGTALVGFAGDVLVLCADTPMVSPQTLARVVAERYRAPAPDLVVLGMRPPDSGGYGRLVTAADGSLEAVVEASDLAAGQRAIALCNSGVMLVAAELLFDLIEDVGKANAQGEYYLPDIIAAARRRGCACRLVEGPADELQGINSRADLARAEAFVQRELRAAALDDGATLVNPDTVVLSYDTRLGRDVVVEPYVVFGPGVEVGDGVTIRAFSHLAGTQIAEGAIIGPFARLRPEADIGPGVHIGNFVEVKKAVIGAGAKINHLAYVGDARVGPAANIGAGTITCNYDGFTKSHTDIGAGAFVGSNASLIAPVKIGDGAVIGAGSVIARDVDAGALGVTRAAQQEIAGWAERARARKAGSVATAAKGDRAKRRVAKAAEAGLPPPRPKAKSGKRG